MGRTRIRWRNAARIGAGIAAAAGLILLVPGLLEPPRPPPLPADIGLAAVPAQAAGPGERSPRRKPGREPSGASGGRDPEPRPAVRGGEHDPTRRHGPKRHVPRTEDEAPAAPVPVRAPPTASVPVPAPVPAQAVAPHTATPPVAEPDPPDPVRPETDPPQPAPQSGPPEFSFER